MFVLALLCLLPVGTGIVIKIGVILPEGGEEPYALPYTRNAILNAVDVVKDNPDLLSGHSISVSFNDSGYSASQAPIAAVDYYLRKDAHVFIGPGYDYSLAQVVRFSSHWGIPVFTGAGTALAFDNKNEFKALIRTGGSHRILGDFINRFAKQMNWNTTGLILYDDEYEGSILHSKRCHFIMGAVNNGRKKENGTIWSKAIHQQDRQPAGLKSIIEEMADNSRIVMLCAPPEVTRELLIVAAELGKTGGDFIYINLDIYEGSYQEIKPWYRSNDTDIRNNLAEKAYNSLMTVTYAFQETEMYKQLLNQTYIGDRSRYNPYGINSLVTPFFDAIYLYLLNLNESLASGNSIWDGLAIVDMCRNKTFKGLGGNVTMDDNGDRLSDYSLWNYNSKLKRYEIVGEYIGKDGTYTQSKSMIWPDGGTVPPLDVPKCGFDGSLCPVVPLWGIILITIAIAISVIFIIALVWYKTFIDVSLNDLDWIIDWEDINISIDDNPNSSTGLLQDVETGSSGISMCSNMTDELDCAAYTHKCGYYDGSKVALKKIEIVNNIHSENLLVEVKDMKKITNNNIIRFLGVCVTQPNQVIVTEYCQKGGLHGILKNKEIDLDSTFMFSLIMDIIRGMTYLHGGPIRSHGNLNSFNCVVDSRLVLKITDFGLHLLRGTAHNMKNIKKDYNYYYKKQWTAPELISTTDIIPEGTQKGDIYSFAIICQEIIYRNGVFWIEDEEFTPQENVEKVRDLVWPQHRPTLVVTDDCTEELIKVIAQCWSDDLSTRPEFSRLKGLILKATKRVNANEDLLEMYAKNMEKLVDKKTKSIKEEKQNAEKLLFEMFPVPVAQTLMKNKNNRSQLTERFDSVTIYFSDICGFTAMVGNSKPEQVVEMLDKLYNTFDSIVMRYDAYKVETIGDAYMVVSGLPTRNGTRHAREVAKIALEILESVKSFKVPHDPNHSLEIRIGLHSGSVCAGVVGQTMPRYCLFGDTVNTASRMESNGLPMEIHISTETQEILETFGTFQMSKRGAVEMKGKGSVITYWLLGEKPQNGVM